jgi:quercetin dioxygenase-like cupin family protein
MKPCWINFGCAALVAGVAATTPVVGIASATPGSGISATILAHGRIDDFKVEAYYRDLYAEVEGHRGTQGPADLVIQEIVFAPGGTTGWHSYGGFALATIFSGTLTLYDEEAPCTGEEFPAGTSFMDPGFGHVHMAQNNGDTPVTARVLYVLPAGAPVRVDEPAPPDPNDC